jgi:ribosomal protein S20
LARTPRKWTGARSPSGLKRVRTAERRHAILGPRRSAAKTLVKNALIAATAPTEGVDAQAVLIEAISALDRAAKVGAIHPNAAARRKSRLTRTVNAAIGGAGSASSHVAKTIGRAAAQKAAKARIAASKADKAKGAQTAAGKARAALSKTSRTEAAAAAVKPAAETKPARTATASKAAAKPAVKKAAAKKAPAAKVAAKTTAKPAAAKAAARPTAKKAAPKKG